MPVVVGTGFGGRAAKGRAGAWLAAAAVVGIAACGGGSGGSAGGATHALILNESFEGGAIPAGWRTNASSVWEVGNPSNVGPATAVLGFGVAATRIADRYANANRSTLDTPPLDLRGVDRPTLQFHHVFDTEASFDGGLIQISTDGGISFVPIVPTSVTPPYTGTLVGGSQLTAQPAWSGRNVGASEGYDFVRVDLDANLPLGAPRDRVAIRFDFASDNSSRAAGWYLDVVQVDGEARLPVPPRFLSAPVVRATEGLAYRYDLDLEGVPAPSLTAIRLPQSLVLEPAAIAGTPLTKDVGQHAVVLTATNEGGVARQRFTLEVVPRAARIASPPVEVAVTAAPYIYALDVTGHEPLAVTVTGLPSPLTYDDATRTIIGTASTSDQGAYEVDIVATNIFGTDIQTFVLSVVEPNPTPFYFEGFEGGVTAPFDWFVFGEWEFGAPTSGPFEAFEGVHVVGTVLDGLYTFSTVSVLVSPSLDLSQLTRPGLQFRHFLHSERGDDDIDGTPFDGGHIKLTTDAGQTFFEIAPQTIDPPYAPQVFPPFNQHLVGTFGYAGQTFGYQRVTLDLDANLAPTPRDDVRIRWDFAADGGVDRPGWYLDAIVVDELDRLPTEPVFTSTPQTSASVGVLYESPIDLEGFPLPLVSARGLPATIALDASTPRLVGTPDTAAVGSHVVTITAANANGSTTQTFTLIVTP